MSVSRETVSLRALRWRAAYNRHLATVLLLALCGLGVWRTMNPPARVVVRDRATTQVDFAAGAYARRFAVAFLSFSSTDPGARSRALSEFDARSDGASGEGYLAGARGSRRVLGSEVVQRQVAPQGARYVIGVDTVPDGRMYLAVTVTRDRSGALQIVGFPALVGAPLQGPAAPDPSGTPVDDADVSTVATRALRNYLAGRVDDLPADLTRDAVISVPAQPLRLLRVSELRWERGVPDSVLATVAARDRDGSQLTLTYELALSRAQTRWFVAGIHTNPTGQ